MIFCNICALYDIFIHIILHMDKDMERKLRMISGSLVVTIPSQIAELYGMEAGDIVTIEQGGPGELRLKKATS